jgi:hypothetical protein
MTRARVGGLAVLILVALAAVALGALRRGQDPPLPRPPAERPTLLLLTSLPLQFSEAFSINGGSPTLIRLRTRYRVTPISVTSDAELAKGRLLLMAQPRAQAPQNLVALDSWVRAGGRVLLLADPMLEWPSERPLADSLRPPPMFSDTGLLSHWGLRLDAPDERMAVHRELGGFKVLAISAGRLFGRCSVSADRLVADCRLGKGRAIVVADADFLGTEGLGDDAAHNLDGLLGELAALERR